MVEYRISAEYDLILPAFRANMSIQKTERRPNISLGRAVEWKERIYMTRYAKRINDRKVLVNRLVELTGQEAQYTRVPRCAYEVVPYTVEKNGDLTVPDENAEDAVIQTLAAEGLIGERSEAAQTARVVTVRRDTAGEPQPVPVITTPQPTVTAPVFMGTRERDPDEDEDAAEADAVPEIVAEDALVGLEETAASSESIFPEPVGDEVPVEQEAEAEESESEDDTDSVSDSDGDNAETQNAIDEESGGSSGTPAAPATPGFPMDTVISLPFTGHTAESLKNLVTMVYSKGTLISKATGGTFSVEKGLVNELLDNTSLHTIPSVRGFLAGYEQEHGKALHGLTITEDRIVFDGFTDTADADHVRTFTQLVSCMAGAAKKQRRVVARETEAENERYSMRTWLLRIGMNGPDFKDARKHLMANLTGHTAFRTAEEAERAKVKAQKKRDEMRAAKEAETAAAADSRAQLLDAGA